MSSFLENINQMVLDAEITEISSMLFDEWMDSNLDEGVFFADRRFAEMSSSNYIKEEFNKHYDLKPEEEHYMEIE
jgi:hypothetical protein